MQAFFSLNVRAAQLEAGLQLRQAASGALHQHFDGHLVALVAIRLEVVAGPGPELLSAMLVRHQPSGAPNFSVQLQHLLAQHELGE